MKKRGRPLIKEFDRKAMLYSTAINIRLTEEQKSKINVVARTNNKSTQQLLRDLINSEIGKYDWIEK